MAQHANSPTHFHSLRVHTSLPRLHIRVKTYVFNIFINLLQKNNFDSQNESTETINKVKNLLLQLYFIFSQAHNRSNLNLQNPNLFWLWSLNVSSTHVKTNKSSSKIHHVAIPNTWPHMKFKPKFLYLKPQTVRQKHYHQTWNHVSEMFHLHHHTTFLKPHYQDSKPHVTDHRPYLSLTQDLFSETTDPACLYPQSKAKSSNPKPDVTNPTSLLHSLYCFVFPACICTHLNQKEGAEKG